MAKLPLTPQSADVMRKQLEAFRKKFGRDPGPGDPVFFDPDKDVPTPMDLAAFTADTIAALEAANAPPEIIYAYKKTGRLLIGGPAVQYPPEAVEEWDRAITEYFEQPTRRGKKPK